MLNIKTAFSGFSVDDLTKAKEFYTTTLGLELEDERMGLTLVLPSGGKLFIYPKKDHQAATYTVLNFVVDDITQAVDVLTEQGVTFERYPNTPHDKNGIVRPPDASFGPAIAWFKDPAGNILSIIEANK